ncbi:cytochrome B561 [Methylocella silvestris BL2]|uniref:Cytochrome B561 n=1 Tax=Methylocella silvestris (strain DSM 15510 / CIP 108128 / LMG 27833 / NCIMB 13906 / BL2) TaxID=395965 RepID=B8EMB5_METSB|nr:cytochrome b/b6 domain-containing protein [Methylocella silvestris]ACK52043.1 cytochrome B561 [Methylocella silvestris BL2]
MSASNQFVETPDVLDAPDLLGDQGLIAPAAEAIEQRPRNERRVWDFPVRVFHWTLVGAIVGAFVTNRLGVSYFKYHVWFGYTVLVLVAFRIVWGFVGTKHALFRSFLKGPAATVRYAANLARGSGARFAGHNPLGAWMVILLLGGLGAQAVAGLFSNDEIFNTGPLAGYVTKDLSLLLTSAHRRIFYWIAAAIGLHILAVVIHKRFEQPDIIKAMFTGKKARDNVAADEEIATSRGWLAAILIVSLGAALALVVSYAPAPIDDAF